jgi:hypothetical protein
MIKNHEWNKKSVIPVEAHGGSTRVEPEKVKGATFFFTVPLEKQDRKQR